VYDECLLAATIAGIDRMVFRHTGTRKRGRAQPAEIRLHAEAPTQIEQLSHISCDQKQRASEIAMKPMAAAGIDEAPNPHHGEGASP
jgi:hypothetical protein